MVSARPAGPRQQNPQSQRRRTAAGHSQGVTATISQSSANTITCNVAGAAAVGVAAQISTRLKATVAAASAVGETAATGLRLAALTGDSAAIGLLAQLHRIFGMTAGNAVANGVAFTPRSSSDVLPGALAGDRPDVDTTRAGQYGDDRPVQAGASRRPRIARTTR